MGVLPELEETKRKGEYKGGVCNISIIVVIKNLWMSQMWYSYIVGAKIILYN